MPLISNVGQTPRSASGPIVGQAVSSATELHALLIIVLLLLLTTSCAAPVPGPGAPYREQTLILTPGDAPIRVAAAPVGRVSTTLDNVDLDQRYFLEFLPLVEGDTLPEGLRLNTYVVTGSGGRRLSSDPLVPTGPMREKPDQTLAVLTSPVRIDLSRYSGQSVSLRWAIESTDDDQAVPRSYVAGYHLTLAEPPAASLPDILMICSDTHRYDFSLGEQGRELMPNLQMFRGKSLTYDWSFSAATWTLPSITSIFTGLPARFHQTGRRTGQYGEDAETAISGNEFGVDWGESPYTKIVLTRFPHELTTLAERLRTLGYRTAMVVTNPMYYLSEMITDGVDIPIGTTLRPGDQINDVVRDVLDAMPGDKPVFLVVHYMDVHEWIRWYYNRDYPGQDAEEDSRDVVLDSYAEAVRDTDRIFGDLLDLWRESRNFDDSLVMFFADHGEHLLDPEPEPLLGHGNSMEDELLHVPLVIKYPRGTAVTPGERIKTPVSLTDLYPTVLDLVGAPADLPEYGGRSLLKPADSERDFFADFQLYDDELSSIRRGDQKLIVNLTRNTSRVTRWRTGELLDPAAGAPLAETLAEFDRSAAEATRNLETAPADTQQAIDALKSLGYIQ